MLRVIGVPVDSVGTPASGASTFGTERSPQALRAAGLVEALGATDSGDLNVRIDRAPRDAETGVVGWQSVSDMSSAVRQAVIASLHDGDLPVVIGGCCSILPAALAGARDSLGVVGLAYIDGHLDSYDGKTSPTGEAADMPISVVVGNGPAAWSEQLGAPIAPSGAIALLGQRDRAEAVSLGALMPEDAGISSEWDPETLDDLGFERAGRDTERAITTVAENYWVHLDVDALSTEAMSATDYLQPGGLNWDELTELITPLGTSDACVGFSLGCYNPEKDPEGTLAIKLVALIRAALGV